MKIVVIISILTTAAAIWGMQCKQMKFVIIGQLVSNALLGLQYVMQDALSAAYTLPPALALSVISLVFSQKGKAVPRSVIGAFIGIFALVIVIPQALSLDAFGIKLLISDILMFIALCFFVLSITSKQSYRARICSATNCLLWLIYDVVNAPATILTHGVLLVFILVGILRLDRAEWRRILSALRRGDFKSALAVAADNASEDVEDTKEESILYTED